MTIGDVARRAGVRALGATLTMKAWDCWPRRRAGPAGRAASTTRVSLEQRSD